MSVDSVIERHLAAVRSGDPRAMACDYAEDAVLTRGEDIYCGREAIEAYFGTVAQRLAGGHVAATVVTTAIDVAVICWRIVGGPAHGVAGRDTCRIQDGKIVSQRVELDRRDF